MRFFRNLFSQFHVYLTWLVLSIVFWGWIYTLVTDTVPARKVTIFADVPSMSETALDLELENDMPDGIKMIRAHPFRYVMIQDSIIAQADIFIVKEEDAVKYREAFYPLDGVLDAAAADRLVLDGATYGIKAYEGSTGEGAAGSMVEYVPGEADYYLFINKDSVHIEDGVAAKVARDFLKLK